jgi:hypothetical protein
MRAPTTQNGFKTAAAPGRIVLAVPALLALVFAMQRPADMPVSAAEKSQIVLAAADRIERYYIDAAKGKEIADDLRRSLKEGPVAEAATALALVPPVNRILSAKGDKHLRFGYSAEPDLRPENAPETPEERAANLREIRENGFGIESVARLEGNIGLLTWRKFHEPVFAGDAFAAAMRLLEPTDALIIDLRNSEGGSPQMVAMMLSSFLPADDPILISSVETRDGVRQSWTLPYVPGPRYVGKKVFLLTSKRTFSAGEGFTEHMRRLRGAVVIGERTKGGARMSRWIRIHPNFAVSVSVARHLPPTKDWEGVGITPDVEVPEGEALKKALEIAWGK